MFETNGLQWLHALCATDTVAAETVIRHLVFDYFFMLRTMQQLNIFAVWACLCEACGREADADQVLRGSLCLVRRTHIQQEQLTCRLWAKLQEYLVFGDELRHVEKDQLLWPLPPVKYSGALMRCFGFKRSAQDYCKGPQSAWGQELVARLNGWYAQKRRVGTEFDRRIDGSLMDRTYKQWVRQQVMHYMYHGDDDAPPWSLKSMPWWEKVVTYKYYLDAAIKPGDVYRKRKVKKGKGKGNGKGSSKFSQPVRNNSKCTVYKLYKEALIDDDWEGESCVMPTKVLWVEPSVLRSLLHNMAPMKDVSCHTIEVLTYPLSRTRSSPGPSWKRGVVKSQEHTRANIGWQSPATVLAKGGMAVTVDYDDGSSGSVDLLSPETSWRLAACPNAAWLKKKSKSGDTSGLSHFVCMS